MIILSYRCRQLRTSNVEKQFWPWIPPTSLGTHLTEFDSTKNKIKKSPPHVEETKQFCKTMQTGKGKTYISIKSTIIFKQCNQVAKNARHSKWMLDIIITT